MSRITKEQIKAIHLGKEETYPYDMRIWLGTLGVVGEAPFYLNSEQLAWCNKHIVKARQILSYKIHQRKLKSV